MGRFSGWRTADIRRTAIYASTGWTERGAKSIVAQHLIDGQRAESVAEQYLSRQGLTFIERNFRARGGEIDLVMRAKDTLVFVEVRFRAGTGYGSPAESVNAAKRKRLIRAAATYLSTRQVDPKLACRFDVVGVSSGDDIEWIEDAFEVN